MSETIGQFDDRSHSALNSLPPSSRLPKTADNLVEYQQLGLGGLIS